MDFGICVALHLMNKPFSQTHRVKNLKCRDIDQLCTNLGPLVARATKFYRVSSSNLSIIIEVFP